jgi:hypothetical protein
LPRCRQARVVDFDVDPTPFDREQLHEQLADLAGKGVFTGTSSWKYPGWRGMVYDESRYPGLFNAHGPGKILVVTGAGISLASGIPTFRGQS